MPYKYVDIMHLIQRYLIESLLIVAGIIVIESGRRQASTIFIAAGFAIVGLGIIVGVLSVIKRRKIYFFYNENSKTFTYCYAGTSVLSYVIVMLLGGISIETIALVTALG